MNKKQLPGLVYLHQRVLLKADGKPRTCCRSRATRWRSAPGVKRNVRETESLRMFEVQPAVRKMAAGPASLLLRAAPSRSIT